MESANGQAAAFYFGANGQYPVSQCNSKMNEYGWSSGWRAYDDQEILWNASCNGEYLYLGVPEAFVIDVETMTLRNSSYNWSSDAQSYNH